LVKLENLGGVGEDITHSKRFENSETFFQLKGSANWIWNTWMTNGIKPHII